MMKTMFKELGYSVDVHNDVTTAKMHDIFLKCSQKDHTDASAFGCCILSHGEEGGIIVTKDHEVQLNELSDYFTKSESLAGKPKMFFVQACRGNAYMEGLSSDVVDGPGADGDDGKDEVDGGNGIIVPCQADFLYAYSGVPGYFSWRNDQQGSWFIQSVVEVFRQHAHEMDVVRMLTRVNMKFSSKKSNTPLQQESHVKMQIGSIVSQLRKELYLDPPNGKMDLASPLKF